MDLISQNLRSFCLSFPQDIFSLCRPRDIRWEGCAAKCLSFTTYVQRLGKHQWDRSRHGGNLSSCIAMSRRQYGCKKRALLVWSCLFCLGSLTSPAYEALFGYEGRSDGSCFATRIEIEPLRARCAILGRRCFLTLEAYSRNMLS